METTIANGENDVRRIVDEATFTELKDLKRRAEAGDKSVVPRLKQVFRSSPELWRFAGNLTIQAKKAWVKRITNGDKYFQEAIVAAMNKEQDDLTDQNTSYIERMAYDQMILCRLQFEFLVTEDAKQSEKSPAWIRVRDQKLSNAHNRYLKALAMYTTIKRLDLPSPILAKPSPDVASETSKSSAAKQDFGNPCHANAPDIGGPHSPNRIAAIFSNDSHSLVCNAPDK